MPAGDLSPVDGRQRNRPHFVRQDIRKAEPPEAASINIDCVGRWRESTKRSRCNARVSTGPEEDPGSLWKVMTPFCKLGHHHHPETDVADDTSALTIAKRTFSEFGNDDCPRLAAALSYYVVFSLPPLLVLILMVAGIFLSPDQVQGFIESQLDADQAEQVSTMISSAGERLSGGGLALILGIAGLIFSATGAFAQLQKALNTAWDVAPDPEEKGKEKVMHLVKKRLLSLGMIIVAAFLLVVALSLSGLISAFSEQIADLLAPIGISATAATVLSWLTDAVVSLAVVTLLFAAMFKVLPDVHVRWKDVGFGAFVTAILFVIGKLVVGWYIGQSNPGEAFGAAGSLAAIMIFVYYASMILLLGAEFTQVWARRHGRHIRPTKHAVHVVRETRHMRDSEEADVKAEREGDLQRR